MMNRNGKGHITKKVFALVFALLLLTASLIAFAEQGTVVTSGGRLNMRKDADERSRIVTKIKNGKTVEVLDHVDGWYHIRFDGQEGYVKEQFIRLLSEAVGGEFVKTIFASFLNSNIYLLKNLLTSRVCISLETPYSKASSHFPTASH